MIDIDISVGTEREREGGRDWEALSIKYSTAQSEKALFLHTKSITNHIPASLQLASREKNLFSPLYARVESQSSATLQRRTKHLL